jgi:hypothetical protein
MLWPSTARPQEATKEKQSKENSAEKQTNPPNFYRVDYTIRELDHGKRTNTRNYTLKVETRGERAKFRVGNRIPVVTGTVVPGVSTPFQYHDVGVNMDCAFRGEHDNVVWLYTKLELSGVAGPDSGSVTSPPVTRNFSFEDTTPASIGKPTLVGAIDDVSDRRYEIEVTVTKLP